MGSWVGCGVAVELRTSNDCFDSVVRILQVLSRLSNSRQACGNSDCRVYESSRGYWYVEEEEEEVFYGLGSESKLWQLP